MKLLGHLVGMAMGLSLYLVPVLLALGVVVVTLDAIGVLPLLVRMWAAL